MTDFPHYALSIRSPWSSAIVDGVKRIENRSWKPKSNALGQRIFIHTSGTYGKEERADANNLAHLGLYEFPEGRHEPHCIIGSARVVGFIFDEETEREHEFVVDYIEKDSPTGEYSPVALMAVLHELLNDPWFQGPVGWILDEPVRYQEPVYAKGKLGVWKPKKREIKQAHEQERKLRG